MSLGKGLTIVAHADDETLWMGGTLNHLKLDWTIIVITNDETHGRDQQFIKNCQVLGAQGYILNRKQGLTDKWNHELLRNELGKIIFPLRQWTMIFSHNSKGEYNHFQHVETHKIVKSIIPLFYSFGFNNDKIDYQIELTENDKRLKLEMAERYTNKYVALKDYKYFHTDIETFKKEG